MKELLTLDRELFVKINSQWTHPILDWLMPHLTELHKNPYFVFAVLPLILGLFYYYWRNYALKVLLFAAIAIGLSDAVCYRVVKPQFQRARPSYTLKQKVVLRTHVHSGYSFPSNHSANNFAAANLIGWCFPTYRLALMAVAVVIAYSRAYVGVHFPLDIFTGALIGIFISSLVYLAGRRWLSHRATH